MRHIGFHEIDTSIYFSKSFLVIKQGVVLVSVTYREGSFLRQYLFMGRAFGVRFQALFTHWTVCQCVVCVFVSMAMCQCVRAHLCKSVQCVMCVFVSMGLRECVHVRAHVTVP